MKYINQFIIITVMLLTLGCSDEFLDNPPEASYNIDNFYTTDDQLLSASAYLYARPWFKFHEKFHIAMGDMYAGNVRDTGGFLAFVNMSLEQNNNLLRDGYNSLYVVVAAANSVIYTLSLSDSSQIDPKIKDYVKGEALFMRAMAYFYLARLWDDIVIIDDYQDYINNTALPRYTKESVIEYIILDLKEAASLLPETWAENSKGRVTSSSAKGVLSKVYLWKASYLEDGAASYNLAKETALEVINSGRFELNDNFLLNFIPEGKNSKESLFSWQWSGCGVYGDSNTTPSFVTPSTALTGVGDGWGSYKPTKDIPLLFEAGDLRRRNTIFEVGNFYPELLTEEGGYTYTEGASQGSATGVNFRKFVIGSNDEYPGLVCYYGSTLNTPILRFSDVLLIHAEADLKEDGVISEEGLASFNRVRARAGLPAKTAGEITNDVILKERRVELVMEGEYWYDIKRQGIDDANRIVSTQDRSGKESNYEPPVVTESNIILKLPPSEIDANPRFADTPIEFPLSERK